MESLNCGSCPDEFASIRHSRRGDGLSLYKTLWKVYNYSQGQRNPREDYTGYRQLRNAHMDSGEEMDREINRRPTIHSVASCNNEEGRRGESETSTQISLGWTRGGLRSGTEPKEYKVSLCEIRLTRVFVTHGNLQYFNRPVHFLIGQGDRWPFEFHRRDAV